MAQIRGTAGYNLGHQNPFGGRSSADATNDPSPLDAIREQTSKIEDWLDTMSDPVKPYVYTCLLGVSVSSSFSPDSEPKQGISRHALTPCSFGQVSTCDRPILDCGDLYRGLTAHPHTMERPAALFA